jgi:hypothetical protein
VSAEDEDTQRRILEARPESAHEMSNFDHSIDDGLDEDLRAGMRGVHSGWDFNGIVWFDKDREVFCEAVRVHHELAGIVESPSLGQLMIDVSDVYGWR